MNPLYPKIPRSKLGAMLGMSFLGALVAGLYGVAHDEITCTISPEYFTRLKFMQFAWADLGLPGRWHVAQIGFLATWWVGFLGVWFLARLAVPANWPPTMVRRQVIRGALLMLGGALLGGIVGSLVKIDWSLLAAEHSVRDMIAFSRVACIHNGSYLGGGAGLMAGLICIWREKRAWERAEKQAA